MSPADLINQQGKLCKFIEPSADDRILPKIAITEVVDCIYLIPCPFCRGSNMPGRETGNQDPVQSSSTSLPQAQGLTFTFAPGNSRLSASGAI